MKKLRSYRALVTCSIAVLPQDILIIILRQLTLPELYCMLRCSKFFQKFIQLDHAKEFCIYYWKHFCLLAVKTIDFSCWHETINGDNVFNFVTKYGQHIQSIDIDSDKYIEFLFLILPRLSESSIRNICKHCTNLRSLHCGEFSVYRAITDSTICLLSLYCTSLERLELQNVDLSFRACKSVSENLTNLKVLSLNLKSATVTDEGLLAIAQRCTKLQSLRLTRVHSISKEGIESVITKLHKLETLELSNCALPTYDVFKVVAHQCKYLKTLCLSESNVTDDTLRYISLGCNQLESLDISGCSQVSEEGMKLLAEGSTQLKAIILSDSRVTNQGLKYLVTGCSNIEHLDISSCAISDDGILPISQCCSKLANLSIYNTDTTDLSLDYISQTLLSLKILDTGSPKMTNVGIEGIAKNCTKLQRLCSRFFRKRTYSKLGYASLACCVDLAILHLIDCGVTDPDLMAIGSACTKLTDIRLDDSSIITDKGMQAILMNCTKLEHLTLRECILLTDNTLQLLSQKCRNINRLLLESSQYTDKGLKHLSECKKLGYLTLQNCTGISSIGVQFFTSRRTNCDLILRGRLWN